MIPPIQFASRKTITVIAVVLLVSASLLVQATFAAGAVTERVSIDSNGGEADLFSMEPSISADGRFIAFTSLATNLVPNDTNYSQDIFVRDWLNGTTGRISIGLDGSNANGNSTKPAVSADGNFIAFMSTASNLVENDTNGVPDIFVYDRTSNRVERVSINSSGVQANEMSDTPAISGDGRYVAFVSKATNLGAATSGAQEIYLFDRNARTLHLVSGPDESNPQNYSSYDPAISDDGNWVAFVSSKRNLVVNDTNGWPDVFVWNRVGGVVERINLTYTGGQSTGGGLHPTLSSDGRYVAFSSHSSDLVTGDTNGLLDIFRRDRGSGTTIRVNLSSSGEQAASTSDEPAISANGRFVSFRSYAANLVVGDTNGARDIFVRDIQGTTTRVSVSSFDEEANGNNYAPAISADGGIVVFFSQALNLDSLHADTNGVDDVYSHGEKPLSEPTPTPTDTATPVPTNTVEPTATVPPTSTPVPTVTTEPTPTDPPEPTETDTPEPTPTDPVWPRDSFNLISICKLSPETGQMRVRNMSSEVQLFTIFLSGGDFGLTELAPIGDSNWAVPWTNSSDTFILHIAGHKFTEAIGDKPLCEPEPTETPVPSETPDPTESPTPEPTDPPHEDTWVLDFELDASGSALPAGTIIDDEWAAFGIDISTNNPDQHPAMIFDSGNPTGYDRDLGSPNEDFGGPGRGSGGGEGDPGENRLPLGNVLILTEDMDQNDPDDYYAGGKFIFTFDEPVSIHAVQILDVDLNESGGKIVAYDGSGNSLGTFSMQPYGSNSVQWVEIELDEISRLTVELPSSGALAAIAFHGEQPAYTGPDPRPTPTPEPSDPPVVEIESTLSLMEGEEFTVAGRLNDPDSTSWKGSVNFDDGAGEQELEVSADGTFSIHGVYGDNGEYKLTVNITDDSGSVGSATIEVHVENDNPISDLTPLHTLEQCSTAETQLSDGKSKLACEVGDWMVARVGEPTAFTFQVMDAGSDDLTVTWNFGDDVTYLNNGTAPDPYPSPLGTHPYTVTHIAKVTFGKPGVKHIQFEVQDDDGGETTISLKVLVRNNQSCKSSLGDWISYFMRKNQDAGLEGELKAHLSILSGFISSAFGEMDPSEINRLEEFIVSDMDQSARARAEMLTAWLNFVNGAVDWDDDIEDADGDHDLTYAETLHRILTILLEDDVSSKQLQDAIELARAINFSNKGGGSCSK